MKTPGIQAFRSPQKSSFLDKAAQQQDSSPRLSGQEQKMIDTKFSGNAAPLEFYEGSGSVRTEHPAARGTNLDVRI